MKVLADMLRNDKVFRESLSLSCLNKLSLSENGRYISGVRLKNEEGAIEKFKKFYAKEYNTKNVYKSLYKKYNIPLVGGFVGSKSYSAKDESGDWDYYRIYINEGITCLYVN